MPVANNGIWQWNIKMLKPRLPLFDGERVCAIVTQPEKREYTGTARPRDIFRAPLITDPPEEVMKELDGYNFKFIVMKNDPNLGEVKTLYPLMKHVKKWQRHDDYTLWAHAKGTTRFWQHPAISWAEMQYESYMDYWPVVEKKLRYSAVAGSFLKWGRGWMDHESMSEWHYSGSWAWFKNKLLFQKPDWWKIDRFWSGIEAYWSLHFGEDEVACIFKEGACGPGGLIMYDPETMKNTIKHFRLWKDCHAHERTDLSDVYWCYTI